MEMDSFNRSVCMMFCKMIKFNTKLQSHSMNKTYKLCIKYCNIFPMRNVVHNPSKYEIKLIRLVYKQQKVKLISIRVTLTEYQPQLKMVNIIALH